MKQRVNHLRVMLLFVIGVLVHCSSAGTSSTGIEGTPAGSSLADERDNLPEGVDNPEVGSNIGNPNIPAKSAIVMLDETPATLEDVAADVRCEEIDQLAAIPVQSQMCKVTNENMSYFIKGIYLFKCVDQVGQSAPCAATTIVTDRLDLYTGDAVMSNFSQAGEFFSGSLSEISRNFQAGGIAFVMAAIEHTFPNEGTNPVEAGYLVEDIRGTIFRLCTSPLGSECGDDEAIFGDYLVKKTDGETFGYFNYTDSKKPMIVDIRPDDYSQILGKLTPRKGFSGGLGMESKRLTDSGYTTGAGYLILTLAFDRTQDFVAGKSYNINISIDRTRSVRFVDGAMAYYFSKKLCVEYDSSPQCSSGNDDPDGEGIYSPLIDGPFWLMPPDYQVQVNL